MKLLHLLVVLGFKGQTRLGFAQLQSTGICWGGRAKEAMTRLTLCAGCCFAIFFIVSETQSQSFVFSSFLSSALDVAATSTFAFFKRELEGDDAAFLFLTYSMTNQINFKRRNEWALAYRFEHGRERLKCLNGTFVLVFLFLVWRWSCSPVDAFGLVVLLVP